MDLAPLYPVFLFFGCLQAVVAFVEPPTNVTLHCHNLHNVLKWSYDRLSPGLRFRVFIGSDAGLHGYPKELWVDPPAPLQADLPFLPDPSYSYYLTVTAVAGQNESEPAPEDGIIFSYFKGSLARKKCFVDFPSVNVTAHQNGTVHLRFPHPWLVYHQKMPSHPNTKPRKKKSHEAQSSQQLPEFSYNVEIVNQEGHHKSDCVESVCEKTLTVDASQKKHCLKVNGELKKISVKGTREYCALREETSNYLVYICVVGGLLALIAVAFVLCMVYRKKTSPSTPLPNSMRVTNTLKQWTSRAVQEPILVPEVGPASPTPLLSPEEKEATPAVTPTTEPDLRLRIGVSTEDEGVCDDVEVGNDDGPGYTHGRNLDEDEELCSTEAPSGYEKRGVLVKLAPGDVAEGYLG